jgi:LysM repeat protein
MYYLKAFNIFDLCGYFIQDHSAMFSGPRTNEAHYRFPLGGKILLLIILFLSCNDCQKRDYAEELEAISARLAMIEQRMTQLEKMEQRLSAYEFQLNELQESFARLDSIVTEILETSQTNTDQPATQGKIYYYRVHRGDSLYGIAQKYGLTVEELSRINNLNKEAVIYPGQRLLVNSKRVQ